MKNIFLGLALLSVVSARPQTADEIIKKYADAMGGLENFKKVKTFKMSGNVNTQGMDLPITVQIINGSAVRTEVNIESMGQKVINVYKDGKGWKINPFAGATSATDLSAAELNDLKMQSFLANQLMDYKARNGKVELQGQEDVNGTKAFKIKFTGDNNKVTTYYINTTSFVPVKAVSTRDIMGQDTEVETYFGDVKDVEGLKFNTSLVQKISGQTFQEIHFDKLELNVPIDAKIFDKQ